MSGLDWNCVQEDKYFDIATTTWIGKLVPISVSISSNLILKNNLSAIPIREL